MRALVREIEFPSWAAQVLAMRMAKLVLVHDDYLVLPLVSMLCTDKRHSTCKMHATMCSIHFRYLFAKSNVDIFCMSFVARAAQKSLRAWNFTRAANT